MYLPVCADPNCPNKTELEALKQSDRQFTQQADYKFTQFAAWLGARIRQLQDDKNVNQFASDVQTYLLTRS